MSIKTQDGRVLEVDLDLVTVAEYRSLFDKDQPKEEEDAIIGKAYGLSGEELRGLGLMQYRRAIDQFFAAARDPLPEEAST